MGLGQRYVLISSQSGSSELLKITGLDESSVIGGVPDKGAIIGRDVVVRPNRPVMFVRGR